LWFVVRFKLLRKNAYPDIQIGVQALLNCGMAAGTCNGGDALAAYKWIAKNGISDETCNPYVSADMPCTDLDMCRICNDDDTGPHSFAYRLSRAFPSHLLSLGCTIIYDFPKFYVNEYGYIPSKKEPAADMITEMMVLYDWGCVCASHLLTCCI